MSLDVIGVCNLALSRVGHTETIVSLDERSTAAEKCSLLHEHVRDMLLRDFVWNFATRIVTLSVVSGGDFKGWDYVYRYPSDCLYARQVTDEAGTRMRWYSSDPTRDDRVLRWTPPKIPHQIASDETGRLILTDMPDAYFVYTSRIEDTVLMDDSFIDLWGWKLALELAPALRVKKDVIQLVNGGYNTARIIAETINMNEQQEEPEQESPAITARY